MPQEVLESASAMGMSARQRFWHVRVPLALPLLLRSMRVVSVQTVGMAVIAALIGAGGFGALVFRGATEQCAGSGATGGYPGNCAGGCCGCVVRIRVSAAEGETAMIEFNNVSKIFAGQRAVNNLNLHFKTGAFSVLIGTSGSGKSTTLKMINRLVEHDEGTILFAGEDIRQQPVLALRRRMGYAIQSIGLFPHWTVAQNIATVLHLQKWSRSKSNARVDELMALLGLEPSLRERFPHQLSGGQQQRVGVARALAADPEVLLMDEPFGALDPVTRAALQQEMVRIHRLLGRTIVLVTHDIDEALQLADHLVLMDNGEVVQQGTPLDMLTAPRNDFVREFFGRSELGVRLLSLRRCATICDTSRRWTVNRCVTICHCARRCRPLLPGSAMCYPSAMRRGNIAVRCIFAICCVWRPPVTYLRDPLLWLVALFIALLLWLPHSAGIFGALFPQLPRPVYLQESFLALTAAHFSLVAVSSVIAIVIGVGVAVAVTRPAGREFRPLAETIAAVGQTFPPVAVLAIAVPVMGFGKEPAIIALVLYGVLPILQGTLAGIAAVPDGVQSVAQGMGMSGAQRLWKVELRWRRR